MPAQFGCADADVLMPLHALFPPRLEVLHLRARLHEVLHLHLLELTHAEDELPRHNLISECFPDLCDTERNLLARGVEHIVEVDKDALRRLGPTVNPVDRKSTRLNSSHVAISYA